MLSTQVVETTESKRSDKIVITPGRQGFVASMSEAWRYRELLLFLAWRDVSVRYKQTLLGVLWVVLQPLVAMLIFTLIFNRIAGIQSKDIPYPLFVLAGQIPWAFFASSLSRSGDSLVTNTKLITKVYFPRISIPIGASLASGVDYLIALVVLGVMMAWYGYAPGVEILALPLLSLLILLFSVGVGLFVASVNVRYRDVKFIMGFVIQMWMFVSPVIYPYSDLIEKYPKLATVILLNPMVGIIEGVRWSVLGADFPGTPLVFSCVVTMVVLLLSQEYFRRVERTFADVV